MRRSFVGAARGERSLAALAAALAAVSGVQLAFFSIWFDARGLSGEEIASLLAAAPAARILSNLAGTWLADRRGDHGRLILVLQLGVTATFAALDQAYGFLALFAGHTLLCFLQGPIAPIFDGLALDAARRQREAGLPPLRLARVRAAASLSVLAFMIASGPVASAFPDDALVTLMGCVAALSLVGAAASLGTVATLTEGGEPARVEGGAPLRRPLLISGIVASAALVSGSHGFLTAFGSLHWAEKGLGADFVALAWSAAVASEFGFFAAAARWFGGVRHAGWLMAAGAAGAVLRWAVLAGDPGPAGVVFAQSLQALSGGALALGPAYLLAELGGRAYATRVHGWLGAANGLALSASLYFSGKLDAAFGQQGYLAMAVMAGLGLLGSLAVVAATRDGLVGEDKTKRAAIAARNAPEKETAS